MPAEHSCDVCRSVLTWGPHLLEALKRARANLEEGHTHVWVNAPTPMLYVEIMVWMRQHQVPTVCFPYGTELKAMMSELEEYNRTAHQTAIGVLPYVPDNDFLAGKTWADIASDFEAAERAVDGWQNWSRQ